MRPLSIFILCTGAILWLGNTPEDTDELLRRRVEMLRSDVVNVEDERIHCTEALPRFYENRLFDLAWPNVGDAREFVKELKRADQHGLNPKDYHIEEIEERLATKIASPREKAELDMLLTDAFLLYSSHLISGKVDPASIDPEWYVRRDQQDPVVLLESALKDGYSKDALRSIRPKSDAYTSLRTALQRYRDIQQSGGWKAIEEGPTLKPGMTDDRVMAVRERLVATGDLASNTSPIALYDEELKAAVIHFQARHGLEADGVLGKKTVDAMNVSVDHRVGQIQANLERWRWLNQEMAPFRVMVNIADYQLDVVDDGERVRSHKVMVGKPFRRTPVFQSTMQYLVLNPTWTVPPTILKNDIIPAVRKNPAYLQSKGLQVLDASGNAMDPSTIDWSSSKVYAYTYRQPAGKSNALGAVKFMFPNTFNVYLHDTPSKELFDQSERAFSSGCIRVQDPLDLTKYLLKGQERWAGNAVDQAVARGQTETVSLARKPAVYILYWTAWTDSAGVVQFRNDVYDRDGRLMEALKQEDPTALASR